MRQPRVESLAHEFEQAAKNMGLASSAEARVAPDGSAAAVRVETDGSAFNDLQRLAGRYGFKFVEKYNEQGYLFRYTGDGR